MRSRFTYFLVALQLVWVAQLSPRQALAEGDGDNTPDTPVVLRIPAALRCRRLLSALVVTTASTIGIWFATDGSMFGLFPSRTERRCTARGGSFQQKNIGDANGNSVTVKLCFCPEGLELRDFVTSDETCAEFAERTRQSLERVRDAVIEKLNQPGAPLGDGRQPAAPLQPAVPEFKAPPRPKVDGLPDGLPDLPK